MLRGYIQLHESGKYLFESLDRTKKQLLCCGVRVNVEIDNKMIGGRIEYSDELSYYFLGFDGREVELSKIDFIEL